MTKKSRRKSRQKVYWKDGLAALQQKEEQRATRHRMWQRTFARAKTELHTEEAVVFLGVEGVNLLRQTAQSSNVKNQPQRLSLPALLGLATALAVSAAGYAVSYRNISARMR